MECDLLKKIIKCFVLCEFIINMFLMNSRVFIFGEFLVNNMMFNFGEYVEKIGKEGEGMGRRGEF